MEAQNLFYFAGSIEREVGNDQRGTLPHNLQRLRRNELGKNEFEPFVIPIKLIVCFIDMVLFVSNNDLLFSVETVWRA
jgi:hypothetical protein